jgi:hypothetical protein
MNKHFLVALGVHEWLFESAVDLFDEKLSKGCCY